MRPIVDTLHEFHVIRVNLTAMNAARFLITDCLQCNIVRFDELSRDIVSKL